MSTPVIYTIGHSTRPIAEFLNLLAGQAVQLLADVRTVPGSRRNPQFNQAALAQSLAQAGFGYLHLPELGGLRKPRPDSINTGWRNDSFRGYADYMQTPEFAGALAHLLALAEVQSTAIMCAEAVPWRCHRSLIGDALAAHGVTVLDIIAAGPPAPHRMTPFVRVEGEMVWYPKD